MIQFFMYFILGFNTPILNSHLDELGFGPLFLSLTIATVAVFYAIMIPFVNVLTRKMEKRGILFLGLISVMTGTLISGIESDIQDEVEKQKQVSVAVIAGLALFGCGFAMVTIPVMPEIIETIENDEKHQNIDS